MKSKTRNKSRAGKKQQNKKIIIASIAVGAAGILGYFGWQYFKKRKDTNKSNDLDEVLKTSPTAINNDLPVYNPPKSKATVPKSSTVNISSNPTTEKSDFPLKKGSKGNNVKLLQQALIAKYGKTILPKYGADGDFGTETANALKKAGLPSTINESTFNVVIQTVKIDPSAIGKELYTAAIAKSFTKVMSLLKQMQSTEDYSAANEQFKQDRINGVRQTIVNGLLSIFTDTKQKEQIKFEFLRMGLQFDGSKWSLSGFEGRSIVTTENTTVWLNAVDGVKVPAKMVLGNEVSRRLDYTLFENKGKYFLVNTKSVNYLN